MSLPIAKIVWNLFVCLLALADLVGTVVGWVMIGFFIYGAWHGYSVRDLLVLGVMALLLTRVSTKKFSDYLMTDGDNDA